MSVHARPDPAGVPPGGGLLHRPSAEHILIAAQRQLKSSEDAIRALCELAEIRNRPAQHKSFRLTAVSPKVRDEVGTPSLSLAVFNPTLVVVYISLGGTVAEVGREALTCPPKGFVVFPLSADDVELGVDPTDPNLGTGAAVVHTFRFDSVQQPYLGVIP
jgi:hypothetical protein